MSFLNPVSEPVLRFSSTDASAPQINYNSRTAGDIKAVLKACLVTGYGAKASAGWSIANEADHVAEFVSPSAAMSDYRLGIDDTSASSTTWYYQYQDARVNPAYNAPIKNIANIDKFHTSNGWQLLVTECGIAFVEVFHHTTVNKVSTRLTYWSRLKSALQDTSGANIAFFNIGHNGAIAYNYSLYSSSYPHIALSSARSAQFNGAHIESLGVSRTLDVATVDILSPIYLASSDKKNLIGQLPALLGVTVARTIDAYRLAVGEIDSRPILLVTVGHASGNLVATLANSADLAIYLDYWEY